MASAKGHRVALVAGVVAVMAAEWVLLVGSTKLNEMLVGAGSVLLSAAFVCFVYKKQDQNYDVRLKDILALWRIPWYVLSGIWEISMVLFKDLLGIERAGSYYRVSGFKTAKEEPHMVTRRALATIYTTVAPNFIIIGIDYNQSRMLFHQLERSSVPKMTQELGASR